MVTAANVAPNYFPVNKPLYRLSTEWFYLSPLDVHQALNNGWRKSQSAELLDRGATMSVTSLRIGRSLCHNVPIMVPR